LAIDYQKRDGVAYITLNNPAKAADATDFFNSLLERRNRGDRMNLIPAMFHVRYPYPDHTHALVKKRRVINLLFVIIAYALFERISLRHVILANGLNDQVTVLS